jgi:cell division protein FtsI (penicillin-binding protein 3)
MSKRTKQHNNAGHRWRRRSVVVLIAFVLAAGALVARAVQLQVVDNQFLMNQAQARHVRVVEMPAHRGMIVDRNGEPLAVSTPVDSVWANPQQFPAALPPSQAQALAAALGESVQTIHTQVATHAERQFIYLRRDLNPGQAKRVMAAAVPGVHLQREYRRYYPAGEVAAQVIGFTNIDDVGQTGLELAYNDWLGGQPGAERVIKDRLGRTVQDIERIRSAHPGQTLVTSLDLRVQYLAYRAIKAAVRKQHAKSGSVVVLDAESGHIIAMANAPSFNPNNRADYASALSRNRAVTDTFEPGSSFKPFVMSAALASGRYEPDSLIDTRPGWYTIGRYTIRDERDYGVIDLTQILEKSSNVGASKIALTLKPQRIYSTLVRFGFGASTNCGFPGEAGGSLRNWRDWSTAGQAVLSYGYGVSVTTLQLAEAYAAIADNGMRHRASFIKGTQSAGKRAVSATVAADLRHMLESVVSPEGTAERARVPGYRVAGKTGTALKAENGSYSNDRYTAVFAGMAPASHPRLVTVVVVNQPSNGVYYGGLVSAPVFSRVMAGALRLLDVAPDDIEKSPTTIVLAQQGASS